MTRRIRLGGFYQSLPMRVAEERGFYADREVEVVFDQVKSSTQQFHFLADGQYDVVQTSPDNTANYLLNDDNPIGRRVDGQGFLGLDYGMQLIVTARPEINSISDLAGKTISVDAPESGFAYVIYKILARHGLERGRDYDIVSTGGVFDRYMAIMEGNGGFAATLLSGGFETRAANQGYRLLDSVYDIADPYLGVWAAAKRDWLADNAELVVDFVRAYLDASAWVFDSANRAECVEMLTAMPNTSPELAEQLYELQVRPGVGNIPNGEIDPEGVRNVLALRQEFSGFEEEQDIDALVGAETELFDLRYLRQASGR